MLSAKWSSLKSGTDIRGVAIGENMTLTNEVVSMVAKGFFIWLQKRYDKKTFTVAIGRDSRISGERIALQVATSLKDMGAKVILTGLSSTPSMFMTTKFELDADAGISITASHHPYDKNGIKFFTKEGGVESSDITEILTYAEKNQFELTTSPIPITSFDFMPIYSNILVNLFKLETGEMKPLSNVKISVDAGNGAGGFYAKNVLAVLGADISSSQFLEPDGNFPNHIPNPENAEAMNSLSERVLKCKSDIGIIFDTDVDRAGLVDSLGEEINRNKLIALISAILLETHPKSLIVTDSVTSDGLTEFIENLGGKHLRFKRGYKNVIDEAISQNKKGVDCPLAIETSGHAAFLENYFLDDGAYLVTKILISFAKLRKEKKNLFDLISTLKSPVESEEIRFTFNDNAFDFKKYGNQIIDELRAFAKTQPGFKLAEKDYEGIRISIPEYDGFFLLRMSLHDPIMPLNIESYSKGGVRAIALKLYEFLKQYERLNLDNIIKLL